MLNPMRELQRPAVAHNPITGQITNLTSGLCLDTDGPPANYVALVATPCGKYTGQGWHR